MQDCEYLHTLIRRASPDRVIAMLQQHFYVTLNEPLPAGRSGLRLAVTDNLSSLPAARVRDINDWAERVGWLADGAGQDALLAICHEADTPDVLSSIEALDNPFDRSLWLYAHHPALFQAGIDTRLANLYRQKSTCHSGFIGPKGLTPGEDDGALRSFHQRMAEDLQCANEQVALELFKRSQLDEESGEMLSLYQVSLYYNLAPEFIDCVKQSHLESQLITRASKIFITYAPTTGVIEVLSKNASGRERIARLFADYILAMPFEGDSVPLQYYDYQCLARPFVFDVGGEPIDWVKVTHISYSYSGRTLEYRIGVKEPLTIYQAAREDIGPQFRFCEHDITRVRISIGFRKKPGMRARTAHITLRGDNGCAIQALRENDRQTCRKLLVKWQLVREVGNEPLSHVA